MKKEDKAMTKKRVTKQDTYKEYGIDYDASTGKIYAPVFGWINPLLIDGNEKIGKGIYHFSMLPTNRIYHVVINDKEYDILGTCICFCDGCYATKGNYNYDSTIVSNAIKTYLARHYIDFVYRAISAQIKADKVKALRIHASGDFFSKEYAEMWYKIASENSACVFWTYTKVLEYETLFDSLSNANIVKSIIPTKGFNFGHCDYILACYEFLKSIGASVYICKCGIDKNQHCTNCKACSEHDFVLFIEHSTSYKAEKDPLFPVLKALIESQED